MANFNGSLVSLSLSLSPLSLLGSRLISLMAPSSVERERERERKRGRESRGEAEGGLSIEPQMTEAASTQTEKTI